MFFSDAKKSAADQKPADETTDAQGSAGKNEAELTDEKLNDVSAGSDFDYIADIMR